MNLAEVKILLSRKPSEREKWMYLGLLVVSGFIYFQNHFYPKYQENKNLYAALEASRQIIAQGKPYNQALKRWSGSALQVEEAPIKILDPAYLQNIEVLGVESSPVTTEESRLKRDIKLTASGSYHALENYVSYLQNMPAPVMIKTLKMKSQETDSELLEMELSGVVYGSS